VVLDAEIAHVERAQPVRPASALRISGQGGSRHFRVAAPDAGLDDLLPVGALVPRLAPRLARRRYDDQVDGSGQPGSGQPGSGQPGSAQPGSGRQLRPTAQADSSGRQRRPTAQSAGQPPGARPQPGRRLSGQRSADRRGRGRQFRRDERLVGMVRVDTYVAPACDLGGSTDAAARGKCVSMTRRRSAGRWPSSRRGDERPRSRTCRCRSASACRRPARGKNAPQGVAGSAAAESAR
jgi:hypothetical protein